ncbi:MAG: shikimate dehydrogenase [Anaerolineae bacterium]
MATTVPVISGETRLVGIIGWPVAHSLSPAIHNAAFQALGLDWAYVPLPVRPERLAEAIEGLRALGFAGASVTIPHKQAVMPLLDQITPAAQAMGAVNTVAVREAGRLVGDNTDWVGFLASLEDAGFDPAGKRCAVIGAGGGARAVVYALAWAGGHPVVFNRTVERAARLVEDLRAIFPHVAFQVHPLERLGQIGQETALLVNATPLGMWPQIDGSPWPDDLPLPSHLTVCDIVYNPLETKLLRQARGAGATTISGLGMLVHQGAAAFRLWTGLEPPVDVMMEACHRALKEG